MARPGSMASPLPVASSAATTSSIDPCRPFSAQTLLTAPSMRPRSVSFSRSMWRDQRDVVGDAHPQRRCDQAAAAAGMVTDLVEVAYRSEEHTSELQSLMRISYAVFCLKKQKRQ